MTNRTILVLLATTAIAVPAAARSRHLSSLTSKVTGKTSDRSFVTDAANGGMAEVELGMLATKNASSDQVKQFGQRMIDDHGKANDELKSVAAKHSITLPPAVTGEQKKTMDRLSKLHGAEFDRAYMQTMLKEHQADVEKFRKEAKSGTNPDVKDFAARTLPTLEEHLKMAKDADSALGHATSGALRRD